MSRAALIRRTLAAAGAATALGAGAAAAKSREEDDDAYRARTGARQIDPGKSAAFREEMATVARVVRATSLIRQDAPDAVKRLQGSPVLTRLENGEPTTLADYRAALDAFATVNPEHAAQLSAGLARFSPARDRDVDEAPAAAAGGALGAIAGLVATRGRGRGVRRLIRRALVTGGAAAGGAALGAAGANDVGATLSGDDFSDIGKAAGVAGAAGATALAGRAGVKRIVRAGAVRAERLRQAMPARDPRMPRLDALDAEDAARRDARKGVKLIERDSDMLAADVLHMERVVERAGGRRVFTALDDEKALARKLRSREGWDDMQDGLDALETAYRATLKKLKVKGSSAPSLRAQDPFVTDPRDRATVEAGVSRALEVRARRSAAQRGRKRTGNAKPVSAVKPKGRGR